MGYIEVTYTIPSLERVRVGYRPLHSTDPFTYLGRYLGYNESPYTIDNLPLGSYEVELTAVKGECGGLCGEPKVSIAIVKLPESTTTTTTSSTTSSTSTTSSSTTTSTTTLVPLEVRWDIFTSDPGEPDSVILTRSFTISHLEKYTIPTSDTSGLYYYIVKEPSGEPQKTTYFNTDINQGDIPDQVWLKPTYSGLYRFYKTNGLASFNVNEDTQFGY